MSRPAATEKAPVKRGRPAKVVKAAAKPATKVATTSKKASKDTKESSEDDTPKPSKYFFQFNAHALLTHPSFKARQTKEGRLGLETYQASKGCSRAQFASDQETERIRGW